ncbi:MAG: DUF3187 family protein [Planctomycetota bacterium]|nr:DUF3187 family protein [Planctomycetota bacterium]
MRSLIAITVGILLGVLAGAEAQAQDGPAGPTSIAVPANWTTPPPGQRLVRSPLTRNTRGYDIRSAPWAPLGPVEVRDEWLLAQPKMTLPAVSPDALGQGRWHVKFHIDRGNDFGWNQIGPAENPTDRRFLIDGEHQTTELGIRYGLFPRLAVGIRIPIHWRGGGFMDGSIDWFHELTEPIGFLDNGRPAFFNDRFRVEGRTSDGTPISWNDEQGTGLGNIELQAYWTFQAPCKRSDWRAALIARVGLPTGTDPYDTGGVDLGLQVVAAKQVAPRWDVYFGVGGTFFGDTTQDGIEYEQFRAQGFLAIEYAVDARHRLLVETNAASRLVTNLAQYPGVSWYINVALKVAFSRKFEFEVGFTENIEDQQGTIDFGAFGGFTLKL